ncbi:HEPN domain-containing protein [Sphingobium cupriresistens]|uniref:Nucleotidyltransferase n=1 Tax=Sphingobium cupriresistens LL01 TaxID=1420583 RepID=A0A0J8AVK1_9SPHN|nr:HEPN domain-containing protein [Sphingobium cupriresistens]KMS58240.1 nucleotidyltransferase [Sphingobium cupriresistens LL01]
MKTLDDPDVKLPEPKRRELAHVVEVIQAGFARAIRHRTMERFRNGKLLKVILFGSYARGDWVEDPIGRYFSDYDILVVVDHEDLTEVAEFWAATEERLLGDLTEGKVLRTPVSLIYHSLDDVNEKLRLGRYFFMDILSDGIFLFDEPGHSFAEPKRLLPGEALQETRHFFEEWFESASKFKRASDFLIQDCAPKEAVFNLHQATERLYHCVFLVRTLYSPKTHNLNRLRALTEQLEPDLRSVWPNENRLQKRAYNLLREAYIKARYSRDYEISGDELAWLSERVSILRELVRQVGIDRLTSLEQLDR